MIDDFVDYISQTNVFRTMDKATAEDTRKLKLLLERAEKLHLIHAFLFTLFLPVSLSTLYAKVFGEVPNYLAEKIDIHRNCTLRTV